jgi:hypothetical protein
MEHALVTIAFGLAVGVVMLLTWLGIQAGLVS